MVYIQLMYLPEVLLLFLINTFIIINQLNLQGCGEEVHSLWIMVQLPGVKCQMQQLRGATPRIVVKHLAGEPLHPARINLVRMGRKNVDI